MGWITFFNNTFSGIFIICKIMFILQNIQYIKSIPFSLLNMVLTNYSIVEKKTKKLYNHEYIMRLRNIINNWKKPNEIQIIKDNNIIQSHSLDAFQLTNNDTMFDLIIYTDYTSLYQNTEISKQVDIIVYYNDNIALLHFKHSDILYCNYKFISLTVKIPNIGEFSIKLSDSTFNYYIVGNKINKLLIWYLLKIQHDINKESENVYEIELIDNNVNILKIRENDEIVLNKDDFTIQKISV